LGYTGHSGYPELVTVVETPEFVTRAKTLLDDEARRALIGHLAANLTAGDLIPGTGGVRKQRWALAGRGKRGGARGIYFFHSTALPLFALTIFAKNERVDLSQGERNELRRLIRILVETYGRTRR
jgi:hypothetical protein